MPLSLELKSTLWFGFRVAAGLVVLVAVLTVGYGHVLSALVWDDMHEEWEVELGAETLNRLEASADREVWANLLWVLIPALLLTFVGGIGIVYAQSWNHRRVVRAVQRIRDTGSYHERLPYVSRWSPTRALTGLFNDMIEQTERQMDRFRESLDSVAHDLRTPLARMRAGAETGLRAGEDVPALRTALEDCLVESEELVHILEALMSIAEAEAGVLVPRSEPVALDELIPGIVDVYEFVGEDRDVRVVFDGEEGLEARGDRDLLRQVVANLVDNAVKFSPDGSTVSIRARPDDGGVRIEVLDEGPGIPPLEIERIWERLYRGDQSRKTPGLGLGLAFVRAVVEGHGGTVAAANRPEGGAVFTVRLPAPRTT